MRHLLNTLFVLTEDGYLTLDGENVVVLQGERSIGRFPLHTLEAILYFGYKGASPALMGACGAKGISLCFYSPSGKFLAKACGELRGNVLLRKAQYRLSEDEGQSCRIARNFIVGKLYNSRWVLERATRDHGLRIDVERVKTSSLQLKDGMNAVSTCGELDSLRGIEGECATRYFGVFSQLIVQQRADFPFNGRSRRPPLDRVNALLSFAYSLLANDCSAALEGVGLDPYVGFLHRDRPGRASLALDVMEELRSVMADRAVISCINSRIVSPEHFVQREDGAVLLNDSGRRAFLAEWQSRKKVQITHPFLKEKLAWGLVPHVQALLLARYLRGDLDAYPPFFWK